jgi:LacI family transcriptional regulator
MIAEQCGVSVATVSRALRHPERHRQETTERIAAVARELGYDPARYEGARRLVLSRFGKNLVNHLIALVFPPFFYEAHYFTAIFQGILDVLTPEGFGLITIDGDHALQYALPPSFTRGDIDGVIIAADPKDSPTILAKLRTEMGFAKRPVVSLVVPIPTCSNVLVDASRGAYEAAGHLLDLGHRHLLHFCGPYEDSGQMLHDQHAQFLRGYRLACAERGLAPDAHLHYLSLERRLWQLAFRAANRSKLDAWASSARAHQHPLLQMLRAHPEITGILALNDPSAILIHHLLTHSGVRVPEDVSLVGFDDTDPLYDARGLNCLTTVRVPLRALGRKAAHLLIRQINGQQPPDSHLLVPPTLVIRGTTAPPIRT